MKYGQLEGPIYCRYAHTVPVINSELAAEFGLEAYIRGVKLAPGRNVKLRLFVNGGTKRMTCHAKIDWVEEEGGGGGCHKMGLSHLSLSDEEFHVLLDNFAARPSQAVEFSESVRQDAQAPPPLTRDSEGIEIVRDKAVTFPVALIEEIDERRADQPFSQFVEAAVRSYLDKD